MISVIEHETNAVSNPYPGMNLAEACNAMEIFTLEACNEFQMDVLLSEHAYLYANGNEVSYIDEAGNLSEKGKALKEKAMAMISTVGAKLSELWDKLTEWLSQRMTEVKAAFAKASMSEKDVKAVWSKFGDLFPEGITTSAIKYSVSDEFSDGGWRAYIHKDADITKENTAEFFNHFVTKNPGETKIDKDTFFKAYSVVFVTGGSNWLMKQINAEKKKSNESVKAMINQVKSAKPDDMDELVAGLKDTIVSNNRITKEAIKVHHLRITMYVSILKAVMSTKEAKNLVMSDAQRKVVEVRDNMKAKAAPAVEGAKKAAGKAGEGVKNAAGAVKGKFFKKPGQAEAEE